MTTIIILLLSFIAILLLFIVIRSGVFLNRDGTVWLGSKLSSINSKAQSIVDEVGQINAKIYEIENDMNEHGIAQAKWFDSMSNILTTIANHTNETTNKVAELVDFEKRNEKRIDEMFARCDEINKLQLAELKKRAHTDDDELLPPKEVVGLTATGICQDCRGRTKCKYFDVNRNSCFVTDRKEGLITKGGDDNVRIKKQCEQMASLVGDEQIAIICVGEYNDEDGSVHCKATAAIRSGNLSSRTALSATLFDCMTKNEELRSIIITAVDMYWEHKTI